MALLLVESDFDSEIYITESKEENTEKKLYLEGVFLQSNRLNRNKRIYPTETLKKHVDEYKRDFIIPGRALGELDHPTTPTTNLERVSHVVEDIQQHGDNFVGRARILNTPMGNIAKNLINEGIKLGVSSRGVGSLIKKGTHNVVSDNYKLLAIDLVCTPSAQEAIVEAIYEQQDFIQEAVTDQVYEAARSIINKGLDKKRMMKAIKRMF